MKILLPHSESKITGGEDSWNEVASLRDDKLSSSRLVLADALRKENVVNLKGSKENKENNHLLNSNLRSELTLPSYQRYDGVVYRNLGYYTLKAKAQENALSSIIVISPLGGVENFTELLPNYKFSFSSIIPNVGKVLKYWEIFFINNQGILPKDESYLSLLPNEHATLLPSLGIKVMSLEFSSIRGHESKKVKGLLCRELVSSKNIEDEVYKLRNKYKYTIKSEK